MLKQPLLVATILSKRGQLRNSFKRETQFYADPFDFSFVLFAGIAKQATRITLIQFQLLRCGLDPLFYFLDVLGRRDAFGQIAADALEPQVPESNYFPVIGEMISERILLRYLWRYAPGRSRAYADRRSGR